ncbi:MAG: diaminopimelate epimerase [Acidobacteriota bacterium]
MTRPVPFFKMSGAGNDFIVLVEPEAPPSPSTVRAWCRRGMSLGADGIILLSRQPTGARMVHLNADGSESELCVNGSRCAARLAFHLDWAQSRLDLDTASGRIDAYDEDDRIRLVLPFEHIEVTPFTTDEATGFFCSVGVPHAVVWVEDLAATPVARLGARLRHHRHFAPAGVNVDFAHVVDAHHVELRTFERGVEAETLACGSGAVATAVVGQHTGRLASPLRIDTAGGASLHVELEPGQAIVIRGEARIVATGELMPGAVDLPAAPSWGPSGEAG